MEHEIMITGKRITKKVLFSKTVEILQPILQLDDWRIVVTYSRTMKKTDVASCQSWPEYKQAKIRLNLKRLKEFNDYEIISAAIHEMLHCITWPLAEWAEQLCKKDDQKLELTRKLDEGLVTNLEKVLGQLCKELVQTELKSQGYCDLDLTFENFDVKFEQVRKKR